MLICKKICVLYRKKAVSIGILLICALHRCACLCNFLNFRNFARSIFC